MPRKRRKRTWWWRLLHQPRRPDPLEKKFGILGTRAGATTAIGWIIAIAATPRL